MDKYITDIQAREAFCNALEKYRGILAVYQEACLEGAFCAQIRDMEAADVAPVVYATTTDAGWDEIYCQWKTCNYCQGDNVSMAIYCNWCGARMDGGERNV